MNRKGSSKGHIYTGRKYEVKPSGHVFDRSNSRGSVDRSSLPDAGMKKTGHNLWFGLKKSHKKKGSKKGSKRKMSRLRITKGKVTINGKTRKLRSGKKGSYIKVNSKKKYINKKWLRNGRKGSKKC